MQSPTSENIFQRIEPCKFSSRPTSIQYIMAIINIKSPIDCQILQDDLNSLTDWQMKFNVAKCHSMRVTRHLPENQIQFEYSLHQQRLEQVQFAKYLGITITDNLGQHVSEILCKATKTMGFLQRNLALAPQHTKEVAYKTLVRPQLQYAAPIWHLR